MPVFIAMLRAINIKPRFLKMETLRKSIYKLGYSDIQTYVQSGNIVFRSSTKNTKKIEAAIEEQIKIDFGFLTETFVRTPTEMKLVAHHLPFGKNIFGDQLYIAFAKEKIEPELQEKILALASTTDKIKCMGREIYWHPDKNLHESKVGPKLARLLAPTTIRNQNTVARLAELSNTSEA